MLPMIALLLPIMIVFLGFSVDLAYMQNTRLELRAVTDNAARAAATALSKTDDPGIARAAARDIAAGNLVAGEPLILSESDIVFGRSEPDANQRFAFSAGATPYNSVQVTGDRTSGSQSGTVGLFFGGMFGVSSFEPISTSTASFLNVDICLVLDRSGSMKGDKIESLKEAVTEFLDELTDTRAPEQVALSSYSTMSRIDQGLTFEYQSICDTVDGFSANGRTAIGEALADGIDAVMGVGSRVSAQPIIILMTDGRHNQGISPIEIAPSAAAQGILVHTITFGDNADTQLMAEVAAATGGRYLHATDGDQLVEVFRELAAQASQLTQ